MKFLQTSFVAVLAASAVFAQAPNPVQKNVSPVPTEDGKVPIFKVEVTSRTIKAINYHHRQGKVKVDFKGTALMPEARGEAEITPNDGANRINLRFEHLSNPAQYGAEYITLVLWGITPEGRTERLGEVTLRDAKDTKAELYATTDLQSFGMIVTAEPYFSVSRPSDVVVMENIVRADTTGTIGDIDAKYELLKRGMYVANVNAGSLKSVNSDLRVPLQLREARQAIAIAKAQGADRYAADTMEKANIGLINAEGFAKSKNLKQLETTAREATQMAEDARRITLQKQSDEADQMAARREMEARESAKASQAKAAEEARLRAGAEADAAAAERSKRAAELATAQARQAQRDAEAARQAALAEQQKLALEKNALSAEKNAAVSARDQAEKDAQALRDRLREQLNIILMTRDSARGLIVNMSDVLFDTDQATLKAGAKEKLAKVSGILLAYPSLRMTVEGYTDSTGSDDYNLKLSQRRADSVSEYLVTNGIPSTSIEAHGMGKDQPVATNDTAAGRQQNRRVEMIVSGEAIGHSMGTTVSKPSTQNPQ